MVVEVVANSITTWRSIPVRLVSSFTRLNSVALLPTNKNIFGRIQTSKSGDQSYGECSHVLVVVLWLEL